jgi:hypothetical protein
VGRFNGHLRDLILLFVDEAFFAGDKRHEGVLKALITEIEFPLEGKYQTTVMVKSFLHIMMASNADWAVPASFKERRFAVSDVADTHVMDFGYFEAMQQQMDVGGYAAMLHELLHRDISDFNVRAFPDSEGLKEQKQQSMTAFQAWWVEVLHRGYVWQSEHGQEEYFGEWQETVTTDVLFRSYRKFARDRHERHPLDRAHFGIKMNELGTQWRPDTGIVGEHLTTKTDPQTGNKSNVHELVTKARPRAYELGNLEQARETFDKAAKIDVVWPDD